LTYLTNVFTCLSPELVIMSQLLLTSQQKHILWSGLPTLQVIPGRHTTNPSDSPYTLRLDQVLPWAGFANQGAIPDDIRVWVRANRDDEASTQTYNHGNTFAGDDNPSSCPPGRARFLSQYTWRPSSKRRETPLQDLNCKYGFLSNYDETIFPR
jgi:hypothetical protein